MALEVITRFLSSTSKAVLAKDVSKLRLLRDCAWSSCPEAPIVLVALDISISMIQYVRNAQIIRQILSRLQSSKSMTTRYGMPIETLTHHQSAVKAAFANTAVIVSSDPIVIDALVKFYFANCKFFGVDCEWVSAKGKDDANYRPVSLLQIASQDICLLVQAAQMTTMPTELAKLLTDKHVLKFGVGIQEDAKRLRDQFGIIPRGWVDLRYMVLRCLPNYGRRETSERTKLMSLSALTFNLLEIELDKSYKVRCSDWSALELSVKQIAYAANDAISALEIFHFLVLTKQSSRERTVCTNYVGKHMLDENNVIFNIMSGIDIYFLSQQNLALSRTSETEWLKSRHVDSDIFIKTGMSVCKGITELAYSGNPLYMTSSKKVSKTKTQDLNKSDMKAVKVPVRNHPLYENCYLQGPDGKVLCTCDSKKAWWYVEKTGGEVISKDPLTVRLTFEPSGRPLTDTDYYTTIKENRCVVCGRDDQYVRKMIVPRDYRRYFPSELKDHLSHDVLLLCPPCHMISGRYDEQMRRKLAEEYCAPLGTHGNLKFTDSRELVKIRTSARAIINAGDKLPAQRRLELEQILKRFANVEELTSDILNELASINVRIANEQYFGSHGEIVVKKLVEKCEIPEFIRMWRRHFLDTMEPKYLPPMWSVDHNLSDNYGS